MGVVQKPDVDSAADAVGAICEARVRALAKTISQLQQDTMVLLTMAEKMNDEVEMIRGE
jgi:hypothetical protein